MRKAMEPASLWQHVSQVIAVQWWQVREEKYQQLFGICTFWPPSRITCTNQRQRCATAPGPCIAIAIYLHLVYTDSGWSLSICLHVEEERVGNAPGAYNPGERVPLRRGWGKHGSEACMLWDMTMQQQCTITMRKKKENNLAMAFTEGVCWSSPSKGSRVCSEFELHLLNLFLLNISWTLLIQSHVIEIPCQFK